LIKTYQQAIDFINQSTQSGQDKYSDRIGLNRQRYILYLLGNPQDQIKTIHIAGTSGKGSTSFYLSSLLVSHGFNVGLTLSPHLLDVRERMLINNQLISQDEFVYYLNQIIPAIQDAKLKKYGQPGYFELLLLLSFYIFSQKKVDYVVLETGIGGLLDSSNTISRSDKICLFTKFGLDHTSVLGPNIKSIAAQKAGIIHQFNPVFSVNQIKIAKDILVQTTQDNQTSINFIEPKKTFKKIKLNHHSISYDFNSRFLNLKTLTINTIGIFQVENSAIALMVFLFLSQRDSFAFNELQIRQTLSEVKFYGRMDLNYVNDKPVILDGAHNPQKFRAMIKSLKLFFPHQKFTIILAYKKRSDFSKMVTLVAPVANNIIITSLIQKDRNSQNYVDNRKSLNKIFQKNSQVNFQIIPNYISAFNTAVKSDFPILITGSLYLVGSLYPLVVKSKNKK
jgi:dihydrofolate synthase/folylpolyglutamate synthase